VARVAAGDDVVELSVPSLDEKSVDASAPNAIGL
jgi:hypothetical protein